MFSKIKILIIIFSIPLVSFTQEIKDGDEIISVNEYINKMDSDEWENDLYECSPSDRISFNLMHSNHIENMEKTNFNELVDYLWFLTDFYSIKSKKFNWRYSLRLPLDDVKFDFVIGDTERTIARAHSPLDGDVRIIVNIDKWEKLSPLERCWLFFHEYAHEAYGLSHGEIKLMYPLLPSDELKYDWNLSDENFIGDENRELNKRANKNESLIPWPYQCGSPPRVSRSFAYLFDALIEFIGYIAQENYVSSKNTVLIETKSNYPNLYPSNNVAFPNKKNVWVYPKEYNNLPD